jgi:hypothetical protein
MFVTPLLMQIARVVPPQGMLELTKWLQTSAMVQLARKRRRTPRARQP